MHGLAVWQYVGEEMKRQCYMRNSWQMPRVPPAHYVELSAQGERRVKYWDFVVRAPLRRSYAEAVEEMRSDTRHRNSLSVAGS